MKVTLHRYRYGKLDSHQVEDTKISRAEDTPYGKLIIAAPVSDFIGGRLGYMTTEEALAEEVACLSAEIKEKCVDLDRKVEQLKALQGKSGG